MHLHKQIKFLIRYSIKAVETYIFYLYRYCFSISPLYKRRTNVSLYRHLLSCMYIYINYSIILLIILPLSVPS